MPKPSSSWPPSNAEIRTAADDPPARPKPASPPTRRRASGTVDVRLSRFADLDRIEVLGAKSGDAVIERRNARVALSGTAPRDEIVLEPAKGALRIADRAYAGRIRVRADTDRRGLIVTNVLELEDYVSGVVAGELSLWSSGLEALRAQAIAARSYAVAALDERGRKRSDPYLFDDVRDQAYRGAFAPKSARDRELAARLAEAIRTTRGVVLLEGERVVDARFHAACGGTTGDGRAIFPETDHECLRPVECAPCRGTLAGSTTEAATRGAWRWTAPPGSLAALAAKWKLGTRVVRLAPTVTEASGRWLEVEVAGDRASKRVPFEELRRALGPDELESSAVLRTWPRPGDAIESGVLFEGRGRGHGVGLCQNGARAYAGAGWSAERILSHFYPGAAIAPFP